MDITDEFVTCVFCHKHKAFLYCKADSANLCLLCDRQMHAANAISRRHLRFLICDCCKLPDVSVRCCAENRFLCRDCNWNIHHGVNVLTPHRDIPVGGVCGSPSAIDLATAWCLEFHQHNPKLLVDSLRQPNCGADAMLQQLKNQLLGLHDKDLKDCEGSSCSGSHSNQFLRDANHNALRFCDLEKQRKEQNTNH